MTVDDPTTRPPVREEQGVGHPSSHAAGSDPVSERPREGRRRKVPHLLHERTREGEPTGENDP